MLGKPAESFVELVKAHPHRKCWQLSQIASEQLNKEILNIPESVSLVVEKVPEKIVETKT